MLALVALLGIVGSTGFSAERADARVWGSHLQDCMVWSHYTGWVWNTHTPNNNACVAVIQHWINAEGWLSGYAGAGAIDGDWGPATDAGVIRWKKHHKRTATPNLTGRDLEKMLFSGGDLKRLIGAGHHAVAPCVI